MGRRQPGVPDQLVGTLLRRWEEVQFRRGPVASAEGWCSDPRSVTATAVLSALYATVPVLSTVGWVPQLWKLFRHPRAGAGSSVPTWALWSFTGVVSFCYATVVVGDALLSSTLGVNAIGTLLVFAFAVNARLRGWSPDSSSRADKEALGELA